MPETSHDLSNNQNLTKTDQEAGFDILNTFERFHQKHDMFRRSRWDTHVRNESTDRFYAAHSYQRCAEMVDRWGKVLRLLDSSEQ